MKNFFWISSMYFKRAFLAPANYLMIGLPIIFMTILYLIDRFMQAQFTYYELANIPLANALNLMTIPMILAFQLFGVDGAAGELHSDLKGPTGARLKVSGIDERVFYLSVIASSWSFYSLTGAICIAVGHFVFGIYFASIPLTFLALALLALMAQVISIIIFYFTKDEKASGRIGYLFGEIVMGITLLPALLTNAPKIVSDILSWFPVGVGERLVKATTFGEIMLPVGVLLGMIAVLSCAVFVIGRRKGYDRI